MASNMDEISTTEAENVDDSHSVSEVAWKIQNTQTRKPPGPLSDVKTKLTEIRQKVDRNRT